MILGPFDLIAPPLILGPFNLVAPPGVILGPFDLIAPPGYRKTITINGEYITSINLSEGECMAAPEFTSFSILRGQALDIEINVPAGIDLSGSTITFGIAPSVKVPYEIMLPVVLDGGVITADLDGDTSDELSLSMYYFSCWADDTPLARGYISVLKDSLTAA